LIPIANQSRISFDRTLQLADVDALLLSFQGWTAGTWIDYRSMRFVECEEDWQIEFALICKREFSFSLMITEE